MTQVRDPDLVESLEEAEYLAWLRVHVWWKVQDGGSMHADSCVEDEVVLVAG